MPPAAELVADKGYDSKALRDWLAERGTTAVIPPRKNRKVQYHYDKTVYRQRNIIERMFCRLKDWRRIATRFDRNIKNFIAAIALAAAVIWWPRLLKKSDGQTFSVSAYGSSGHFVSALALCRGGFALIGYPLRSRDVNMLGWRTRHPIPKAGSTTRAP